MESVIVSIKPEWIEKIVRGEKTIEVRKSAPKEVPFRAYIYCTKSNGYEITVDEVRSDGKARCHNCIGKVVATFVCDKVDMELVGYVNHEPCYWDLLLDGSCLTKDELMNYGKWKTLYGWHITDLKIYDKPKELSEFRAYNFKSMNGTDVCGNYDCKYYQDSGSYMIPPSCAKNGCRITHPPQSWQFVEELEK